MLWRLPALVGGAAGLGSLFVPYALVTGDVLGIQVGRETYTLYELADLLEQAGSDPEGVYVILLLVIVGSTIALVGSFVKTWLAFAGGVVQGAAAAAFAYGATAEGSQQFFQGLAQMDMYFETGFTILVVAAILSMVTLPLKWLTGMMRPPEG